MAELERELGELGRELVFPPAPDLVAGVRARLPEPRAHRFLPRRLLVAAAAAVLLVAVGVAFAVPQARTAILRVFGVGSVTIRLVDRLPERPVAGRLVLGERTSLAGARDRVSFPVVVPGSDGFSEPDAVYVDRSVPGGVVFFLYGSRDRPTALLSQFPAGTVFAHKSVEPGSTFEEVEVDGARGYWIDGAPHQFVFEDARGRMRHESLRLATNTLVWEREGITLRLEGELERDQAIRVAESVG